MSVPIPPPDQTPLWRRLITALLLAVWPVGGFILLLGSAAGESNLLGQGFATLVEGAVVDGDRGRDSPGRRHSAVHPSHPQDGWRFHHRGECARFDDSLGRRPCDDPGSRYPPLGLPVVLCRRLPD